MQYIPRTRQAHGLDLLLSATEAASPLFAHQAAEKVGMPLSNNRGGDVLLGHVLLSNLCLCPAL
jgi:hypothetical protein